MSSESFRDDYDALVAAPFSPSLAFFIDRHSQQQAGLLMRKLALFLLVSVGLFATAVAAHYFRRPPMVDKVSAYVAEPVRDMLRQNPAAKFDPNQYDDDIPVIWPVDDSVPQVFEYTYSDPQAALVFQHARMIWVTQFAGVVTDVLVSVSERKVTLEAFYRELTQTAADFTSKGWISAHPLPSYDVLKSSVESSRANSLDGGLMTFKKGSVSAAITLKGFSQASGTASAASAEYVLNVQFSDPALHDVEEKKVYYERLRVNGSIDKSLKLSYWLNRR